MERPVTLSDFHGECRSSGEQLCYRVCPLCGSDEWKLYVSPETGLWKCFAARHDGGGKVDVGLSAHPEAAGREILNLLSPYADRIEWEERDLPEWEPLSKVALRYLAKRGIGPDDVRRLGLVEQVDKHRILVPFFDRRGRLIYYTARRYSDMLGHGPKYLTAPGKHPLYELRPPKAAQAVLVEGVFDAIRVWQAGRLAIALGGKSCPAYLKKDLLTAAAGCDRLYIGLDGDALGSAWALRDKLPNARIVPLAPGQDPGSMAVDEIINLFP